MSRGADNRLSPVERERAMKKPIVIMLDESVHQHGKCGDPTCPCASDPELPAASSLLTEEWEETRQHQKRRILESYNGQEAS